MRACLPLRSSSCPIITRFCSPVSSSSTDAYWPVRPTDSRTLAGSRATSWPLTTAVPASAWISVARMRTAVVLPAPLGPRTPSTLPRRAARSTPSSAWVAPKRLRSPSASIAYSMPAASDAPLAARAQIAHTPGSPVLADCEDLQPALAAGRGERALLAHAGARQRLADRRVDRHPAGAGVGLGRADQRVGGALACGVLDVHRAAEADDLRLR